MLRSSKRFALQMMSACDDICVLPLPRVRYDGPSTLNMYNAGQEPYRELGLTVHEHEILDDESLRTVARAKAQYNKKYREVRA